MKTDAPSYKVAFIGAGNISQALDNTNDGRIRTHVKAFAANGSFELAGICDPNLLLAREAAAKWKIAKFGESLSEIASPGIDVICICSPDETHERYLVEVLKFNPKVVVCEKPIGFDSSKVAGIVSDYAKRNIPLLVNYSRRFFTSVGGQQRIIASESYGHPLSARVKYHKGLFHIASHFLDLLNWYLPFTPLNGCILQRIHDYSAEDPTLTAAGFISTGGRNIPLILEGYDHRITAPGELEICFEQVRLRIYEQQGSKIEVAKVSNAIFRDYLKSDVESLDPSESMKNLVVAVLGALSNGTFGPSTGSSALEALTICNRICQWPELPMTRPATTYT